MDRHPVIELIKQRKLEQSKPGSRKDSFKVGLAIEGGGMRGIVSAGMVTGLEYLGLLDCFDVVIGSSAGAINGAYFIAGQAAYGTTIYYENINNNKFIKDLIGTLAGLISNKPIMNLDYLFNQVMIKEKILDWKKVVNSQIPLKVLTSSIEKRKAVVMENFNSRKELFQALRASSLIFLVAGEPAEIDGEHFWDASMYESIPLKSAFAENCTHVLVLRTRPDGILRGTPSLIERSVIAKKISKYGKSLGSDYLSRAENYKSVINSIEDMEKTAESPPFVYSVKLSKEIAPTKQMEKRRQYLVDAASRGLCEVLNVFTENNYKPVEILFPYGNNGHKLDDCLIDSN